MNSDYTAILFAILRRTVPAAFALAIGTGLLLGAGDAGGMLLGFSFFLIAAIFLAGPIARLLAEPVGGLLWPKRYYDKPQPMYGIPQSKRAKGLPEEALAEYEKIVAVHPGEVRPHLEMIDIVLLDLKDPERADALYQRGLTTLTKPEDKNVLTRTYTATRTRLDVRPPHAKIELQPRP